MAKKADKTTRIQFRWNPDYKQEGDEAEALRIRQEYLDGGDTDRDLFKNALLAFYGKKVVKSGNNRDVMRALVRLEEKIDQQSIELNDLIVKALQGIDMSQYTHRDTGRSMAEELGSRVPETVYQQMFQSIESESFEVD